MSVNVPLHTRRLAGLVNRPGGITVSEAVMAAEANLETLRDRGLEEIAAAVARMLAVGDLLKSGADAAEQAELYKLSNFLVGVSGVFGYPGLGEVAFSLCSLLDRLRINGLWSMPSVRIHLDSLRLVHSGNLQGGELAAISMALRQVVDRVPATPA